MSCFFLLRQQKSFGFRLKNYLFSLFFWTIHIQIIRAILSRYSVDILYYTVRCCIPYGRPYQAWLLPILLQQLSDFLNASLHSECMQINYVHTGHVRFIGHAWETFNSMCHMMDLLNMSETLRSQPLKSVNCEAKTIGWLFSCQQWRAHLF